MKAIVYIVLINLLINTRLVKAQKNNTSGYPEHIILNVTDDLSKSIALNWRTDSTMKSNKLQVNVENSSFSVSTNYKEYMPQSEYYTHRGVSHWYHSIILDSLLENTTYAYRVGNEDKWSPWINFKTLPKQSESLKFIYLGDVQSNIKNLWSRLIKQAFRTVPDAQLILYAGDIVNRGNNMNEWEEWFEAGSYVHQTIPVMPAAGNHDHGDDSLGNYNISSLWQKQFNLPNNGIKDLKESSYCVNIQDVKFVVLNTELFETDEGIKSKQLKWLDTVLSNNTKKWLVLLMHHPIYSTKKNRDNVELRALIKPLIDRYKVDLVLQGHDHTYARGKDKIPMPNNSISHATYVVSVSGPKLSQVLEADWMDKSYSYIQLFQSIEITGDKLIFKSYNLEGTKLDEFEIFKKNGINTLIEK